MSEKLPVPSAVARYSVAIVAVAAAFLVVSVLQYFLVRTPVILIYLVAITVSVWRGGKGPGLLAFCLSTFCILLNLVTSAHGWLRVVRYDLPTLCIYLVLAWWIESFARSSQHLEQVLRSNQELEVAVRERTAELIRINTEYRVILEAAPFGVVLFGPGRIIQRCNPAYERMVRYSSGELLGRVAPLPEDEWETWNEIEKMARVGKPIDEYETVRLRRDGSRFSATIWVIPLHDDRSNFTGMVGFILDSTERKESEVKLRASLEANGKLIEEIRALQERLQRENISLQERNLALRSEIADIQRARFEKIIGNSPAIRRTLNKVEQVSATDVTVLITGETGTGKELIAQAIHENSKRAGMPFRAINCAALPATLMAAELFGHEKGAFTGAERLRLGQFELASGGTLFLDEIAEIPVETQAMLLRVLEERGFERLGGTKLINSNVRIIAATNRDLHTAMQRGEFRQDLFFRLNGFRIEMPPLRERKEDIPLLVQHFVQVSTSRYGKLIRSIEKGTMEMLLAYGWPGNVRELRNVIDTSVIISPGEDLVIDEGLLFGSPVVGKADSGTLEAKVAEYERGLIERTLIETHGRVSGPSGAATLLGMPASTLSARIRVLKIDVAKFKIQSE
ncbi:sigma 54-interacting transcriptional regulator [Edaphobacter flagellatus]|uniref:sigma 54-interacting transcriptional regulator n=1 Tax=Edaphobacter flagellatus TaxID=1933044 RepID=UPI0021B23759|nr:sigma 54-interacting transcriptional regulator [Edaphobacter flagellatus]